MSEILYQHWLEAEQEALAQLAQVEKNLAKFAIEASRQLEFDYRVWGPQDPRDSWSEGC